MSEEERAFRKFLPKLTEVTEIESARFESETGGIVSTNCKRSALDALTLVLATDEQTFGPFLLNGFVAKALCAQLIAAGFGT